MRASTAWVLAAACACGGGTTGHGVFSTTWDDDGGKSIAAVRQRLAGVPIPLGADVAVGVAGHSSKLVGQPLAGGPRWTFAHALDARPIVTGRVVVASGGANLFALDAVTGKLLWTRPTGGLALRGAGDDGTITVATLSSASGRGSTLLAVSHDGAVLRQIEPPVELGSPAVVDRLAFVPWQRQYVSVLDVTDGSEVGRVLLREKTSRAWLSGGALYFGEVGLFRFDDKITDASRGGADHLGIPTSMLPGHPLLMRPGEEMQRAAANAADKIRLYARPTPVNEPLALDGDRFYATYFRLVFGLSPAHSKVEWVHTHASAVIGGSVGRGNVVLCDVDGKLTTLDARNGGQVGDVATLGEPLESCVVQADGFKSTGATADPGPLVQQIRTALSDRDLELDAGQTLVLRELAGLPDETATELLIKMAVDPRGAPGIVEEVRTTLASRKAGARYMVAALEKHYDFLHDVTVAPPVGPIAHALASMNATNAAPALAAHLFDPADTAADVRDVAQALAVLATPAEVPSLLRFFAFYHDAPPDPDELPVAVGAVAEALLRVGGAEGRSAIDAAIREPGTNAVVRSKLRAIVEAAEAAATQRVTPSTKPSSTSRE